MLKTLSIRNYALIEELSVEFGSGLNIITGETGAGKSIIIDALGLVLGERAESEAVRKGAEKSIVESSFAVEGNRRLRKCFEERQLEYSDELLLRREVSLKGQNRCFINDSPATNAVLKEVGDLLVDLHGQHEHQSLLRVETHIDLLDDFGGLRGLVDEFRQSYDREGVILRDIAGLRARERQLKERLDLYDFQMREIDAVGPRAGEEQELERELTILENAETLFGATERLYRMLYEGDNAVHDQLILARNELENLAGIDNVFEEPKNEAAAAAAIVDELAKFIQRYNSKVEFDPDRLEAIRDRLGHLALLKKKYGGSLEAIISHREHIGREYSLASNFESEMESLRKRFLEEREKASEIAQRLSAKRHEVARKINRAIADALTELGIPRAVFETRLGRRQAADPEAAPIRFGKEFFDCTATGVDDVEFFVSTNPGEDLKPLARVASGGEISRIMLALKMVLAKADRLPILVFDEIDVGVSGRIAQSVGQCLKKLSQFHQVIAITHLPQIAGLADSHYVVEKLESGKRSVTRMRSLDVEERVAEVAKLLSGEEVTSSGLESARELMGLNDRRKRAPLRQGG